MKQQQPYVKDSTDEDMRKKFAPPPTMRPARDFVMLAATYNQWLSKPDSVKTRGFNYGFSGFFCYDFPIKTSNFSFATGIGVNVAAMYLNQQQIVVNDTSSVTGTQARFIADTAHFTRYKMVTSYLQAPFELRYFGDKNNRNKGFKAALGLQIGTLMGAHTKGVTSASGTEVTEKLNSKRFLSPWQFSATARVGWGNFSLFASYNLSTLYKENEGPAVTPASAGICITGL